MPRFVLLEHDHPHLHWDLMLEAGAVLRTWRLAAVPRPGAPVAALASFDHRLVYLDYEGPVSDDRGRVRRVDAGTFAWEDDRDGCVVLWMEGEQLRGRAVLERGETGEWTLALR